MMPTFSYRATALIVCAIMTESCAGSPPISTAVLPRLTLSAAATRPCELHHLPAEPTLADLEVGYMTRGRQIADCDQARRLAVDTLTAERAAIEAGRPATRRRFGLF